MASSAETIGADNFDTGFDTYNLRRPTLRPTCAACPPSELAKIAPRRSPTSSVAFTCAVYEVVTYGSNPAISAAACAFFAAAFMEGRKFKL